MGPESMETGSGAQHATLPAAVRAWELVGRIGAFRGRARVGTSLVRQFVRSDRSYTSDAGRLRIDPEDYFQACMLLGIFDPVGVKLAARFARPGSIAIDGGAFIGYFTLHLARAVGSGGQVHSFEPDPRVAPRLREHVALNRLGHVRVVERALLDRSGLELDLRLPDQLGFGTVAEGHLAGVRRRAPVRSIALDDYVLELGLDPRQISFIKLDVEGVERAALEGMEKTLDSSEAAVLVEVIPERMRRLGQSLSELIGFMAARGYEPWLPRLRGAVLARGLELQRGGPDADGDLLFTKRQS